MSPRYPRYGIKRQGHVHVEAIERTDFRPGFRRWYVQTEQKRPGVHGFALGRDLHLVLGTKREDGSEGPMLYLREGEDGSVPTALRLRLPRTLPWREWDVSVHPDKWGCLVTVFTTSWPARPSFLLRTRVRGYLHRMRVRASADHIERQEGE